jgi:hypothetical protein
LEALRLGGVRERDRQGEDRVLDDVVVGELVVAHLGGELGERGRPSGFPALAHWLAESAIVGLVVSVPVPSGCHGLSPSSVVK